MGKMLLKKLKGRKREQKLQHLHMADLAMFLTGDHCNTTETLPFNNKYDTWRGRVWKNAVHIMGLICMTTHALEKVTFISFKIDDVLWRQPINGLWTVDTGCFRESTNSTEPTAGTWCPINQTVTSQYLLNMPIRINVVMTEPSISPRKRPAYQERETNISLASATTNWETHLSVRLRSHRSAAWKPGQNHDYQLHSSPNPVRRNREKTTALTNRKRAHHNLQTHTFWSGPVRVCPF